MMKPTLAMLAFTVLTATTGASHALTPVQNRCDNQSQHPTALGYEDVFHNFARKSPLWLATATSNPFQFELKAWSGTGYKTIARGESKPYFAQAWSDFRGLTPKTSNLEGSFTLPTCPPPEVPTGYIHVNDGKGSAELFYLDQRVGTGSDLFVSPAVGWGVDEHGVYFQDALVIGSEQFCKLVYGFCSGIDAATITATAQSIAQQVLQDRFAVVHVLGHQVWVQPMVADDFGRRNESAADLFSHRVNQLYRKRHSAASSAMSRDSGRIVLNAHHLGAEHLRDNSNFYIGDAGLYYQDRLVEPIEEGRNIPALIWRTLPTTSGTKLGMHVGIATQSQVFLSINQGRALAGADAASFQYLNHGYGKDANRVYYGAAALAGVPSGQTASGFQLKTVPQIDSPIGIFLQHPNLFWLAGVPHTAPGPGGVTGLKRLHGVQNMLTDDIFVYDMQGLRFAVADVVPYVCDTLHLQAAPPNAYIKATRQGAEPAFYSWQGQPITHPLDLAAIQAAKCQRND